jgi:hypothetical protein
VSRSATLDEPPVRRDLVSPIDGDVQQRESLGTAERLDAHAELSRSVLGRRRRGDAPQVEVARGECRKEERDSRAGSEPDEHPVLDQLRRRLGGELLLPVDAHETTPYGPPLMPLGITALDRHDQAPCALVVRDLRYGSESAWRPRR